MKDELISFETAQLAKEKGFDWDCYGYYESSEYLLNQKEKDNWNSYNGIISAPTQSLLQKWLREKYNIYVTVSRFSDKELTEYCYLILDENSLDFSNLDDSFDSYEEALEKGLFKGLELIK